MSAGSRLESGIVVEANFMGKPVELVRVESGLPFGRIACLSEPDFEKNRLSSII